MNRDIDEYGYEATLEVARDHIETGRPDLAETLLRQLISRERGSAEAWIELGRALNNLRRFEEATSAFREAIRRNPDCAESWNYLGHVLRASGQIDDARHMFDRALEIRPDFSIALKNRASTLLGAGMLDTCIAELEEFLRHEPADPEAHNLIASAFHIRGDLEDAETHYQAALGLKPELSSAATALGAIHHSKREYQEAVASYRKALTVTPEDTSAAVGLAAILGLEGRPGEGLALLDRALSNPPLSPAVAATASRLLRQLGRPDEAWSALKEVATQGLGDTDRSSLSFVRADLLHDAGDTAAAFSEYRRANSSVPDTFDPAGYRRTVDRLIGFFTPERMAKVERSGHASDRPVFIVGMPRSGTTLVEQVLAAHPKIQASGERTMLFDCVRELAEGDPEKNWPEILERTPRSRLAELSTVYLTGVEGGERLTDKLPANFLNLGLINLLFPNAKVIFCRRDPLDVGLSCYRHHFLSPGMSFACKLENIAAYQQGCTRLMGHWSRVLDLSIFTIDYELLATDPEPSIRALIKFLELPWEDACLHPDRVNRLITTASYEQVRHPFYSSSVGAWRRYSQELEPLRAALELPWCDVAKA